ncbi:MAG: VWA domain-containing protein [Bacillota bacterium]
MTKFLESNYLYLFILLPIYIIIYFRYNKSKKRSNNFSLKKISVLILRLIMVSLLIIALSQPVINTYSRKQSIVFLVDRSDSLGKGAVENSLSFLKNSLSEKKEEDKFAIVSFAEKAVTEKELSKEKYFSGFENKVNGSFSNIENALKKGIELLDKSQGRVILLSDGEENLGNSERIINDYRDNDINIDVFNPSGENTQSLFIENLILPGRIRTASSFEMKVYINSSEKQQGKLRLYHNEKLGREEIIELNKGNNYFEYNITLSEPGFHSFRAEIEGDKDYYKMNNVLSAYVIVEGAPHILCLDGEGKMTTRFLEGLQENGFAVSRMESKYFSYNLRELQKYDAVIMENIAADSLNLKQIKNIISYVSDTGGGLLVMGGENAFGAGSYTKSPLNALLPLNSEVKSEVYFPTISISIVFDKSNSMKEIQSPKGNLTKLDLAKEATIGVIDLLVKEEKLGIIAFDTNSTVLAPLQAVNDKYVLYEKFSQISSGGGTNIYSGLKEAHKMLEEDESSVKHVILISDGKSSPADFDALISKFNKNKISLTTVAVGGDADKKLMKRLAREGNGEYYYTDTIKSLPAVFSAEAKRITNPSIINKKMRVNATGNLKSISNINQVNIPVLNKFNATTQQKTADLLLYTENNFPVMANWRYGLGRTVAFTGDSGSDFAVDWTEWKEYDQLWSDILKWLMRSQESNLFHPYIVQKDDKFLIKADVINNDGEYVNHLDINTVISGPGDYQKKINLDQRGPGLYQAEVEVGSRGTYLFTMNWEDKSGSMKHNSVGYVLSYSPEYLPADGNKVLEKMVDETNGRKLENPQEVFSYRPRYVSGRKDLWHIFVFVALIIFMIEIALRVVSFNLLRRFLYSITNRVKTFVDSLSEDSKDI